MSLKFPTFESKFKALEDRNPEAEGEFIYCVLTTAIFCRPTCSSRLPLRKHVIFCSSNEEAIEKNFRACKRCKPDISDGWNKQRELIENACCMIMKSALAKRKLDVKALIQNLQISKWHFYRIFRNYTGSTPRQFFNDCLKGVDPLVLNPLPIIQTKKYLLKRKSLADSEQHKIQQKSRTNILASSNDNEANSNTEQYTSQKFGETFENIISDINIPSPIVGNSNQPSFNHELLFDISETDWLKSAYPDIEIDPILI